MWRNILAGPWLIEIRTPGRTSVASRMAGLRRRLCGGGATIIYCLGRHSRCPFAPTGFQMEVLYAKSKLRKMCGSPSALIQRFGAREGRLVLQRLNELKAASSLLTAKRIPALDLHQLSGEWDERFAVKVIHGLRIVLEVGHDFTPRLVDGGVNLEAVTTITVLEITDYH